MHKRYKSYLNFVRCEYRNHCEAFRTWDVSSYGIVWNCNVLLFVLAGVSQCFTSLKTELLPNHNWNGRSIIFSGCFSICVCQIKYRTKVLEVCHKNFFHYFPWAKGAQHQLNKNKKTLLWMTSCWVWWIEFLLDWI